MSKIILLLTLVGFVAPAIYAKETVQTKMQKLKVVLQDILVDVYVKDRFFDKKNANRIGKNLKKFRQYSHDLDKTTGLSPKDPAFPVAINSLNNEIELVQRLWSRGEKEYARERLQTVTSFCISCHTRSDRGLHFKFEADPSFAKGLDPYHRGELFTAIRNFDQAQGEYTKAIDKELNQEVKSGWWYSAIQRQMMLLIRVKGDADAAEKLVDKILGAKHVGFYTETDVQAWKEAIKDWKRESRSKGKATLKNARRLVKEAGSMESFHLSSAKAVYYWRASAMLHELMSKDLSAEDRAEALLLAGICYENLGPVGPWILEESYYRQCLRVAPAKSDAAKKCFYRLENALAGPPGYRHDYVPADLSQLLALFLFLQEPKKSAFRYPHFLNLESDRYAIARKRKWKHLGLLRDFLSGRSSKILEVAAAALEKNHPACGLSDFQLRCAIEVSGEFYERLLHRNWKMLKDHQTERQYLLKEEVDDALVKVILEDKKSPLEQTSGL